MINGVILQKLELLDKTLAELKSLGRVSVQQLQDDWKTLRAIERDLQILEEIVVDTCQRVVSLSGQAPATTGMEAVERCIQLGALADFEPYRKMVQLRNFIVHRYEREDLSILVDMINRHLDDFIRFREEMLAYVRRSELGSA